MSTKPASEQKAARNGVEEIEGKDLQKVQGGTSPINQDYADPGSDQQGPSSNTSAGGKDPYQNPGPFGTNSGTYDPS